MFTLDQATSFEQVIKKSRFIAMAGPLANEQEAKRFIAAHSDPNANHNCWAWRARQLDSTTSTDQVATSAPVVRAHIKDITRRMQARGA